jgi:hypothetical protein
MDLGSIMLIASSAILVGIFLSRPFFENKNGNGSPHVRAAFHRGEHKRSSLLAEKERILTALRDLDFDNQLGKIPVEDYPGERSELLQQGAAVLKQLDVLDGKNPEQTNGHSMEALVSSRQVGSLSREENDALEDMIALHRNSHKDKAAGFCPGCGKPVHKTDQFCPRCGRAI